MKYRIYLSLNFLDCRRTFFHFKFTIFGYVMWIRERKINPINQQNQKNKEHLFCFWTERPSTWSEEAKNNNNKNYLLTAFAVGTSWTVNQNNDWFVHMLRRFASIISSRKKCFVLLFFARSHSLFYICFY